MGISNIEKIVISTDQVDLTNTVNGFNQSDNQFDKQSDSECLICFENFTDNQDYLQLDCKCVKSIYHTKCIYQWISIDKDKNNKCIGCYKTFKLDIPQSFNVINDNENHIIDDQLGNNLVFNQLLHYYNNLSIKHITKYFEISILIFLAWIGTNIVLLIFTKKNGIYNKLSISLSIVSFFFGLGGLLFVWIDCQNFMNFITNETTNVQDIFDNIITWKKHIKWIELFLLIHNLLNTIIFLAVVNSYQQESVFAYSISVVLIASYLLSYRYYDGPITRKFLFLYSNEFI